jgi:CDP-paratose 2-epimerase
MKKILIIGGTGFIGSNAVFFFSKKGWDVTVADNFSRQPAGRLNAIWLKRNIPNIKIIKLDIRKPTAILNKLVSKADVVLHLAAQVAVTTSVENPRNDFENNAMGTLNVLEAVRISKKRPIIIYSSTNKVYGESSDIKVEKTKLGWRYKDKTNGIDENQKLDFHSPYGCSKGSADQYVRDYSRIYGISTVVFRQSCIYGPRQFGSEDQGWVAWFTIRAVLGRKISIYGDGFQSRDILHVDDLNRAYELAIKNINKTKGQIYNIGGGRSNRLWLNGLLIMLNGMLGEKIEIKFDDWRPGDQKVFVSDIRKAKRDFDWEPKISMFQGVKKIFKWVNDNKKLVESAYKVR